MANNSEKCSYVLQGWPVEGTPPDSTEGEPALVPLPFSNKVREWCQAGKKVRVTFEVEQV